MNQQDNHPVETHEYQEEYNKFMFAYKSGNVSGEEVGELIMKMAYYYTQYQIKMIEAERVMSKIAMANELKTDDVSGKPISSTKAKTYTDASEEAYVFNKARMHVQNIETKINALKALQKGVLFEYANSGSY